MLLLAPLGALAATLEVDPQSGPYTSIHAAVSAASDGDRLHLAAGDYAEDVDLLGRSLELVADEGAVLRGTLSAVSGETLSLSGLVVRDAERALLAEDASITLVGVRFEANGVYGGEQLGGAVQALRSTLVVSDSAFVDNAGGGGGHLYLGFSTASFTNSRFEVGDAAEGGAILSEASELTLTDCDFTGNAAEASGGAVLSRAGGALTVQGGLFEENAAVDDGGALYLEGLSGYIEGSSFVANTVYSGYGAALYLTDGSLEAAETVWLDNQATYGYGGALWAEYEVDLVLRDSEFDGNFAYRYAGAIGFYYAYGTLTAEGLVVRDNTAQYGYGGGLFGYVYADLEVRGSVFEDNLAYYNGGGLYNYYYGTVLLEDVDLLDNRTKLYSGGGAYLYYLWTGDSATLRDVRVEGNEAALEGGGLFIRLVDQVELEGVQLRDNGGAEGLFGGGAYLAYLNRLRVHASLFHGNRATYGGGFYEAETQVESSWTNTVLQENQARVGAAGCFVESPLIGFRNNDVLGNAATDSAGGLCLVQAYGRFSNSVFAYNTGGAALHTYDLNSGFYSSFAFDAFHANAEDIAGEHDASSLEDAVFADPGYPVLSLDGDPDNDSHVLALGSPLIDAGDPELSDADGSRSDIGAVGGPDFQVEDQDADGWGSDQDCDDQDPTVHPEAEETWYDGVNQDCGLGSDFDQDGDGLERLPEGLDCDDLDAGLGEDCPEDEQPGEDDTGGEGPAADPEGCGGCGGGLAGAPAWLGLLLLGLRRRR